VSGFVVDSRTLVAVRDTLGRLNEQLLGMHTVIWHQSGTLGAVALESELEHFCGTWQNGVAELGGQLQDLTRRLSEAAQAYERIEERITQAGAGSTPTSATGTGQAGTALTGGAHHATAKHHAPATHHPPAKHHVGSAAPGRKHYSGGAAIAPATGGSSRPGDNRHSGDKHTRNDKHAGVGSGTTVIGGAPGRSGGTHRPGTGSGVTVIGGPSSSSSGSGTTTTDEKIHHAEERQQSELAAVVKLVER
jgi:hypothetical protein